MVDTASRLILNDRYFRCTAVRAPPLPNPIRPEWRRIASHDFSNPRRIVNMSDSQPRPNLRCWQFSLRKFVLLVTLTCFIAGVGRDVFYILAVRSFRPAQGCEVIWVTSRPLGPSQQRGLRFEGPLVDDEELARTMVLSDLASLNHGSVVIENTAISEDGITALSKWKGIRRLTIKGQKINENSFISASRFSDLESLYIVDNVSSDFRERLRRRYPNVEIVAPDFERKNRFRCQSNHWSESPITWSAPNNHTPR